jgi:hypothetical protein
VNWLRYLGVLALVGGCRGDTGGTPGQHIDAPVGVTVDAAPGGPDSPAGTLTTIKSIRQNPPGPNDVVEVKKVIVVARVRTSTRVTFFVQDQGGGEFSGIQVFCPKNGCTQYDALGTLQRGDVVDISGKYSVFLGEPELSFVTVTEKGTTYLAFMISVGGTPVLSPEIAANNGNSPVVTVPGGTMAAVATLVPASQVSTDFDVKSADFQRFHQVLVKVNGPATVATVTASNFDATVGAKTIFTDIAGFFGVTWCGTPGCGANEIHVNDVLSSMTGVIRIASQKTQFAITRDSDLQR